MGEIHISNFGDCTNAQGEDWKDVNGWLVKRYAYDKGEASLLYAVP